MKVAVFNDTRTSRGHFGCHVVMRSLEISLRGAGIEPVWFWPVAKDWRAHHNDLPRKGSVDAVIVNGEGTIHHSELNQWAEILADVAEFSREHLSVPAFLINATLCNNSSRLYKKLSNFDMLFVRDSASLAELESNGLKGVVVPDLTFALQEEGVGKRVRQGVGSTDSVIGKVSRETFAASKSFGWEFMTMVDPKISKLGFRDVLNPRVFAAKVKGEISRIGYPKQRSCKNPEAFLDWLKSKELVVTGRYHAVTLALLTRTPFIAIESNTPKISFLLQDVFGSKKRVISDVSELSEMDVHGYSSFDLDECVAVNNFLIRARSECARMAESIRDAVSSQRPFA